MPKEKVEAKQSFVHDDINAHKGQLLELTESQAAALRKAGLVGDPAAKLGATTRAARARTAPQNKMATEAQNKTQQTPASGTEAATPSSVAVGTGGDGGANSAGDGSGAGQGSAGE